jgi:ribonuclease P protein component
MLASNNRVKQQYEINSVLKSKLFYLTPFATIKMSKGKKDAFQLVVIISKKIYKRSNKRNRIRRKVMALFEELQVQHRLPPYTMCAIRITNKDILHLTKPQLQVEIVPTVQKLFLKHIKQIQKP